MPLFVRIIAGAIAALFLVMALATLAHAIALAWAAVASPPVAALATAISYLSIAVLAVGVTLIRTSQPSSKHSARMPNSIMQLAGPFLNMARRKPSAAILIALAAGAFAEHLESTRKGR